MAHYAFLDSNNIVTEVIVGQDETNTEQDWEVFYGNIRGQVCKRTSYNTVKGVNLNGGTAFRKNYAGVGYKYDSARDAFIPSKPYDSWTLNEFTCTWEPPTPCPNEVDENGLSYMYLWNESQTQWDLIT